MKFIMLRAISAKLNRLMFAISQSAAKTLGLTKRVQASSGSPSQAEQVDSGHQFLFEHSFDAIVTTNARHEIVAANSSAQVVLGSAVSVVPVPADRFIRCANDHTTGEPRGISELLEQKDAWTNQTVPAVVVRADGRHVPMRLRVVAARRGETSGLILFLGATPDTGQQDAEVDSQDSEQHVYTLAAHSADLLAVIDDSAKFIYCSPSSTSMLGYDPTEISGTSAFDVVHPDDNEALSYFIIETFRDPGVRNSATFRCQRQDGTSVHLEAIGTSFVSGDGRPRGVIILRDISRRLSRDHQRQQAEKLQALGQLAGGIAHDFNNLFTAVIGCLQMIDESGPAGVQEQIATALRAVMRGSALTGRLLGFARRQPLEPQLVHVGDLVARLEPALRGAIGDSMDIRVSCDDKLWQVQVDPTQLESAILDLATNSRDAASAQGTLSIEIQNRDAVPFEFDAKFSDPVRECVCISVADDGSGMSEESRRRATEPFYTTKSQSGATGLGLSTVYGFVCQSGGYFRIRNRRQKGARVDILLPRASESLAADLPYAASLDLPLGDETVLVVDDDADVRNTTVRLLSGLGYKVLSSSAGSEALEVLVSTNVDLLFTDVRMPGMNGFELADKALKQFPQLRILLTSGFVEEPIHPTDVKLIDRNILPKPYDKEDLAKRVRTVLDDPK